MKGDEGNEIPLSNIDFSFLKDLHPAVAIVFIIFFFIFILISILLIYKYKCKKEDNVHDEVLKISENQTTNIKTLFSNLNAHPPNGHTPNIISLEQYKEKILGNTLEEYKQSITGDFAPVRKNRHKKRIQNRQSRKGVKN